MHQLMLREHSEAELGAAHLARKTLPVFIR